MCVVCPVGSAQPRKTWNQIRQRHPHFLSDTDFPMVLAFITATAKKTTSQRYVLQKHERQCHGETASSPELVSSLHGAQQMLSVPLKHWTSWGALWIHCRAPGTPSAELGSMHGFSITVPRSSNYKDLLSSLAGARHLPFPAHLVRPFGLLCVERSSFPRSWRGRQSLSLQVPKSLHTLTPPRLPTKSPPAMPASVLVLGALTAIWNSPVCSCIGSSTRFPVRMWVLGGTFCSLPIPQNPEQCLAISNQWLFTERMQPLCPARRDKSVTNVFYVCCPLWSSQWLLKNRYDEPHFVDEEIMAQRS